MEAIKDLEDLVGMGGQEEEKKAQTESQQEKTTAVTESSQMAATATTGFSVETPKISDTPPVDRKLLADA